MCRRRGKREKTMKKIENLAETDDDLCGLTDGKIDMMSIIGLKDSDFIVQMSHQTLGRRSAN